MKKINYSVFLLLTFVLGLAVFLYPTISDYVNSKSQSRVINEYSDEVAKLDKTLVNELIANAHEFNVQHKDKENPFFLAEDELDNYFAQLRLNDTPIMGSLEIPVIDVKLPIYHGTDDSVLQVGIGHFIGSSLPVGGIGTHSILSGHRALPSATLLSHLDRVEIGDTFSIDIMTEKFVYEVDQILIVDPKDISALLISKENDYVTLLTCTPYGQNTHRLLVRGHRIEYTPEEEALNLRVTHDAIQIDSTLVAQIMALPVILIFFIYLIIKSSIRPKGPYVRKQD